MMVVLYPKNLKDLSIVLLDSDGRLNLLSYKSYSDFDWESFRFFCHENARYGIPTIELVEYLKDIIGGRSAIEIGAGHGDLGYHLGIHRTDSKMQESPDIQERYRRFGQPTIKYPKDVEKIEALDAVKKYNPQVVVASWVTVFSATETSYGSSPHGIKEDEILKLVDTYILVGNISSHGDKPIMAIEHKTIDEPFIISRSANRDGNRIFIWDNKNE